MNQVPAIRWIKSRQNHKQEPRDNSFIVVTRKGQQSNKQKNTYRNKQLGNIDWRNTVKVLHHKYDIEFIRRTREAITSIGGKPVELPQDNVGAAIFSFESEEQVQLACELNNKDRTIVPGAKSTKDYVVRIKNVSSDEAETIIRFSRKKFNKFRTYIYFRETDHRKSLLLMFFLDKIQCDTLSNTQTVSGIKLECNSHNRENFGNVRSKQPSRESSLTQKSQDLKGFIEETVKRIFNSLTKAHTNLIDEQLGRIESMKNIMKGVTQRHIALEAGLNESLNHILHRLGNLGSNSDEKNPKSQQTIRARSTMSSMDPRQNNE